MLLGDPQSVSFDASYHKEHELWFRDEDQNGF